MNSLSKQSLTVDLKTQIWSSKHKHRIRAVVFEKVASIGRLVFKHDDKMFPGFTSGSEFFAACENFEMVLNFWNGLDFVDIMLNSICELGKFTNLHRNSTRQSSYGFIRQICVILFGYVRNCSSSTVNSDNILETQRGSIQFLKIFVLAL